MAELIRSRLQEARPRTKRRAKVDPLLEVAGLGRDGRLTAGIDEDIYGV